MSIRNGHFARVNYGTDAAMEAHCDGPPKVLRADIPSGNVDAMNPPDIIAPMTAMLKEYGGCGDDYAKEA